MIKRRIRAIRPPLPVEIQFTKLFCLSLSIECQGYPIVRLTLSLINRSNIGINQATQKASSGYYGKSANRIR